MRERASAAVAAWAPGGAIAARESVATPFPGATARDARTLSVVVTTCAMPDRAARCVASILACDLVPLEVLVIENRPAGSRTAAVLAARFPGDPRVRCVEEPRRGLSSARNRGLACARGEIVAFTDDDVVVQRGWSEAIVEAFASDPRAVCVTGPILPLALRTQEERTFERFARLSKGAARQVYSLAAPPEGDVLFPYAAGRFGSGADIALLASFARSIGGFDVRLGAGTHARGGEDLDLFIRVLRVGGVLVYEPRAAVRHEHLSSRAALRQHALDYGIGLSATMTKQLADGRQRRQLLRRIPAGLRHLLAPGSPKNSAKGPGYPRSLDVLEWLGILLGPFAYLASAAAARRRGSPR